MSERPPILSKGVIVSVRVPGRLYDVEMPNGYVAIAVLPKGGPTAPTEEKGSAVEVAFSPYDMSRCKVVQWLTAN
ncbi:MAG: hypothetical protein P1V20_26165 [Verrucomicrobiales bacterium]|nr:hypothetical protein [Verrucomicrobiales bacterium]